MIQIISPYPGCPLVSSLHRNNCKNNWKFAWASIFLEGSDFQRCSFWQKLRCCFAYRNAMNGNVGVGRELPVLCTTEYHHKKPWFPRFGSFCGSYLTAVFSLALTLYFSLPLRCCLHLLPLWFRSHHLASRFSVSINGRSPPELTHLHFYIFMDCDWSPVSTRALWASP